MDLDSNAGTVETDVLLSSYKGEKPEGMGYEFLLYTAFLQPIKHFVWLICIKFDGHFA